MMKIVASLRVKTHPGVGTAPPDPTQVAEAASIIEREGVEVLRQGRRSLTVSAELADLERLAGTRISGPICAIDAEHAAADVARVVDLIEIASAPKQFVHD